MSSLTPQQNTYKILIDNVIISDKKLSSQGPIFKFESGVKVLLQVSDRDAFQPLFESYLKQQKVTYTSVPKTTIINFSKFIPGLKPLTIRYKPGGTNAASSGKLPKVKTAMQERGAAYIFEQSLVKNVDYDKKIKTAMTKLKVNQVALTPEDINERIK